MISLSLYVLSHFIEWSSYSINEAREREKLKFDVRERERDVEVWSAREDERRKCVLLDWITCLKDISYCFPLTKYFMKCLFSLPENRGEREKEEEREEMWSGKWWPATSTPKGERERDGSSWYKRNRKLDEITRRRVYLIERETRSEWVRKKLRRKKVRREEGALIHSFSPTTHICGSLFLLEQNFCALQLLLTAYEKQIGSHFHQVLSFFISFFFSLSLFSLSLWEGKSQWTRKGRNDDDYVGIKRWEEEKKEERGRKGESWCLVENEVTR